MRLSTRLLLIMIACLVPVIAAEIYNQVDLYEQRHDQLEASALRQVEAVDRDIADIVTSAREAAGVMTAFPSVRGRTATCSSDLTALLSRLPAYLFLAVLDDAGKVTCATLPDLLADARQAAVLRPEPGRDVGDLATLPAAGNPFLPVFVPIQAGGTFVLALDQGWLSRHLRETHFDSTPLIANATVMLTDRRGAILARYPEDASAPPELPAELRSLVTSARNGSRVVTDPQGRRVLAVMAASDVAKDGVATVEMLPLAEAVERANATLRRGIIVIAVASLLAVALVWFVGRRFIRTPTRSLIKTAEALARGDLQKRADGGRQVEFAALADALNRVAESLEVRERTRGLETELLQAQLAHRTRELSENNNRLQVEIAERDRTEAALTHAQKLQAIGQLAGGIAHDFNNMLATVLGSLELMERRVGQNQRNWTETDLERVRTLIQRATGAVQRGAQLTSGLLAFSRRPRVAARPTDINRLIEELATLAISTLGRRIRLSTELDGGSWPAMVDPSQVEAAVLNLSLNARDAMPDGGTLTIRTSNVTISAGGGLADDPPPGEYVCVSVADTGAGMPPDVQRRAFDPFFTTKGDAGSGLGLSQVQQMVRQSGGSVRLRSTPGRGTEVTLLLPRAAADAAPENAPRVAAPPRQGAPSVTVLVVDDDAAVRQVTVEMLRDLGCDVLQAGGGAEALSLLSQLEAAPDIVLLDYAMPGMNGLTLARRLRDDGMKAPMALVTGYAELNELEAGETPLNGLLRKPFTIEELQSLLTRLGSNSRPPSNVVRLPVSHRR